MYGKDVLVKLVEGKLDQNWVRYSDRSREHSETEITWLVGLLECYIDIDDGYIDLGEDIHLRSYSVDRGMSNEDITVAFQRASKESGIVFEREILTRLDRLLHAYTNSQGKFSVIDQAEIYHYFCEPTQGRCPLLHPCLVHEYIEIYCACHNVKLMRSLSKAARIVRAALFIFLVAAVSWYSFHSVNGS